MTEDEALAAIVEFGFSSPEDARGFLTATPDEQARILAALKTSTQKDVGLEILSIIEGIASLAPYGTQIRTAIEIAASIL